MVMHILLVYVILYYISYIQSRRSEVEDANQSVHDVIFGNGQDDLNDSGQQAKPDQTAKNKDKATGESKYQKGVMNNYITVSNEYACYYNAIYVSFFFIL